jgi:hypothetical protein
MGFLQMSHVGISVNAPYLLLGSTSLRFDFPGHVSKGYNMLK